MEPREIVIPPELRPSDGRFGSGPSKVRPEALAALCRTGGGYLGTSHRQSPVRAMVRRLKAGLHELFQLPDGYEIVLGNGGTTVLWDALIFGLVARRSQHAVFGEFSEKFAQAAALAPHLLEPEVVASPPGTHPFPRPSGDVDVYALTHNETSTGVAMPVERVGDGGLVVVDATSGAGGLPIDPSQFDVYYFAPQKCFASDGGLWVAMCSPAAIERIQTLADEDRYIPPSIDLCIALENSRQDQTYNTPALATLFLFAEQVEWMLACGGLRWSVARCSRSADIVYSWAADHPAASPFVKDPDKRSRVVATIDLDDAVDARALTAVLRANGIVDTEPYRKLRRNQVRIGLYPAIEPSDVEALVRSIDFVIDALREGAA
jgi:phosphoserine aminotransferase